MKVKSDIANAALDALKIIVVAVVIIFSLSQFENTTTSDVEEDYAVGPSRVVDAVSPGQCSRKTPYAKPEEFERALSLILQRHRQVSAPQYAELMAMSNCLDIRYAELQDIGIEGAFYFDESVSSVDKLVIEIDFTYSVVDDLTTAFLLSHEIAHARQFVDVLSGVRNWGCVEAEVDAFYSQLLFGAMLNEEEGDSMVARIERGSNNSQLNQYENLIELSWDAIQNCGLIDKNNTSERDIACYKANLSKNITAQVVSNPYYQEQCKEELE